MNINKVLCTPLLTLCLFFASVIGLSATQESALMQSDRAANWFLCDKKNNMLHFEWIANRDLCEEEQLYLRTFKELYKDVPESYFGPQGLMPFLQKIFAEEKSDLRDRYFVSVKKDGHVVAFASFKKSAQEHEVYLKFIIVDATYRRCGIGEELILTILKKLPNTQRIVLDTRKKNNSAHGFYKKLGFKECACIDKDLPQEWYTGFEGNINELIVNIERLREPTTKEQAALVREILQYAHTQPEEETSLLRAFVALGLSAAVIIAGILLWRAYELYHCNEMCRLDHHHRNGAHCRIELLGLFGLEGHEMHSPDNGDQ